MHTHVPVLRGTTERTRPRRTRPTVQLCLHLLPLWCVVRGTWYVVSGEWYVASGEHPVSAHARESSTGTRARDLANPNVSEKEIAG